MVSAILPIPRAGRPWWRSGWRSRCDFSWSAALGLSLPSEEEALTRLREVATGPGRDSNLIFTPEGTVYGRLIDVG